MSDSMVQPFRRNLQVRPIIGPVGPQPVAVAVPDMTGLGITSFIIHNVSPVYFWFAGWKGTAGMMPNILENGHYIAPGEKYLGRTQMPNFVAAHADAEPNFPAYDEQGNWLFTGQRLRWILTYGSGL